MPRGQWGEPLSGPVGQARVANAFPGGYPMALNMPREGVRASGLPRPSRSHAFAMRRRLKTLAIPCGRGQPWAHGGTGQHQPLSRRPALGGCRLDWAHVKGRRGLFQPPCRTCGPSVAGTASQRLRQFPPQRAAADATLHGETDQARRSAEIMAATSCLGLPAGQTDVMSIRVEVDALEGPLCHSQAGAGGPRLATSGRQSWVPGLRRG